MEFIIASNKEGYFLKILLPDDYCAYDDELAEFFDMRLREYQNILWSFGGSLKSECDTYFESRHEAEVALEEFMPKFIAIKLSRC